VEHIGRKFLRQGDFENMSPIHGNLYFKTIGLIGAGK